MKIPKENLLTFFRWLNTKIRLSISELKDIPKFVSYGCRLVTLICKEACKTACIKQKLYPEQHTIVFVQTLFTIQL